METPAAEFAEEPRALDKAYDDYITEVGADAVAAQFGVPVDFVESRKLKPDIAFFLFDRQDALHKTALEAAKATGPKTLAGPRPMIPMTQRTGNWIDPVPPRKRDEREYNSPVM